MKKLLIIPILFLTLFACGQTEYEDLDVRSVTAGSDGHTVYLGGQAYKMTHAVLFSVTGDSLALHLVRLDNLTDTTEEHINRILALEGAGSGVSLGTSNQIPHMNTGGTDFDYDANLLWTGSVLDISGDINLSSGDIIYFNSDGNNDSYILASGPGEQLTFYSQGLDALILSSTDAQFDVPIRPQSDKGETFGTSDEFWGYSYLDRVYVDSTTVYIDVVGTGASKQFTFTDPVNGTSTHEELLAGGGGSDTGDTLAVLWDAVFVDTAAVPYSQIPFGMGYGLTGDTAASYINCHLGGFVVHADDDTINIVELTDITAYGPGTPSVAVQIEFDDNTAFSSPTTIWSGTVTGTPTTVTSFTTAKVPPDNHVRAYITATPADANKSSRLYIPMLFY